MFELSWMLKSASRWVLCLLMTSASFSFAELADIEAELAKSQQSFIQRFQEFTEDKNVMGKAKSPDGTERVVSPKDRFDADGGGFMPFKSDLTYHDHAYNITDPNSKEEDEGKSERLFAFVSDHGAITGAAGSSQLERKAYELHKQFSKEDEDEAKKADEEEGISFRSIYKVETREVEKGEDNGKGEAEVEKVERITLRDGAKEEIEQVGAESFETIRQAGRDAGFKDDENTLPNGVLLRAAAGAATQAWWNSTLANLSQRRIQTGLNRGDLPRTPELQEAIPNCETWGQNVEAALAEIPDEAQRKAAQEEISKKVAQCNEMASMPYNVVNPDYEFNDDGEEQLEIKGAEKEDAFQRDSRLQLEVLAGKNIDQLESNWQYEQGDKQAKRIREFQDGQPGSEVSVTVRDQFESYNNQLQEAQAGMEDIQSRFPDYKPLGNPMDYAKNADTESPLENNQTPVISAFDEVGIEDVQGPVKRADTYDQLLQQN